MVIFRTRFITKIFDLTNDQAMRHRRLLLLAITLVSVFELAHAGQPQYHAVGFTPFTVEQANDLAKPVPPGPDGRCVPSFTTLQALTIAAR